MPTACAVAGSAAAVKIPAKPATNVVTKRAKKRRPEQSWPGS
jgi:hypothetical protein